MVNKEVPNFLVVGLGSMGKRRIRCLQTLGYTSITGYDQKEERCKETHKKYGVWVTDELTDTMLKGADVIIISTPPDKHNEYIEKAIAYKKPAFVEASVILNGLRELNYVAKRNQVYIAPSCTMKFHPAIEYIRSIVMSGKYGKITDFTYHSGQYLPDWHPYESIQDFYVSNKETSGCREIIPFELTWLTDIMGYPKRIFGYYGKTMSLGIDIDDTYIILMDMGDILGCMTVDIVSRYATRSLILNLEKCQILWRWDEGNVKLYEPQIKKWDIYKYPMDNYDAMYVKELDSFIKSIKDGGFLNSLDEDIRILELLSFIEVSH